MNWQPRTPIALTIAGSDSSGGAGIQADLKTFSALCVYGASVITALTAQNTRGVQGIEVVSPAFVGAQLHSVLSDLQVDAIKTGMLASAGIVTTVADVLRESASRPLVIDPVMVATSGDILLAPEAVMAMKDSLLPLGTVVTPNVPEAAALLGTKAAINEDEMTAQAKALLGAVGCGAVLIKGGHATGDTAVDILVTGISAERFVRPRIASRNTHGTGCTLSAAIAAFLAQQLPLREAIDRAKVFVWEAMQHGKHLGVGRGAGPVDHLYAVRQASRTRNEPPSS